MDAPLLVGGKVAGEEFAHDENSYQASVDAYCQELIRVIHGLLEVDKVRD